VPQIAVALIVSVLLTRKLAAQRKARSEFTQMQEGVVSAKSSS